MCISKCGASYFRTIFWPGEAGALSGPRKDRRRTGAGGSVDARATKKGTPQCRRRPGRCPCGFSNTFFKTHCVFKKSATCPDKPRPASGNKIYSPTWQTAAREDLFFAFRMRSAPKTRPDGCPGESSGVQAKRVFDKMAFSALAPACFLLAFA